MKCASLLLVLLMPMVEARRVGGAEKVGVLTAVKARLMKPASGNPSGNLRSIRSMLLPGLIGRTPACPSYEGGSADAPIAAIVLSMKSRPR